MKQLSSENIHLTLVEDDKLFAENLWNFLSTNKLYHLGKIFDNSTDVFQHFSTHQFYKCDILILDLNLNGKNGADLIPDLLRIRPTLNILILSTYEETDMIIKALELGAIGYISKRDVLSDLMNSITIISRGGSTMSPSIANQIIHYFKTDRFKNSEILSPRQNEILKLLSEGKTYKETSDYLAISVETVRSHAKRIYRLLQVKNITEAVKKLNHI